MSTENKQIKKNSYIWNTASGMINAGQSALILVFLARLDDHTMAGIFTIAYALANLVSTMGKYGVRNYQVTDIKENTSFADYRFARLISGVAVIILSVFYLILQIVLDKYSFEKAVIVFIIILWKMIDTFEDVYYGMYQQRGRLDIGAKYYTLRLLLSTFIFCVLLYFKCPLLISSIIVCIISAALSVFFIQKSIGVFNIEARSIDISQIKRLLITCFPLFVGSSLAIYVGNAPKYCIDFYMDEKTQAIFGYIMMPAFIIMVLNQFIYQPIIRDLAELWQEKKRTVFRNKVFRQYLIVAVMTFVVIIGGVVVGIPILSLLYNFKLAEYKYEFIVMLTGGGAYALASFLTVVLTVMREQNKILIGYTLTTVISLLIGKLFVEQKGMMGAAILYLILNLVLAVIFTSVFIWRNKGNDT